MMKIRATRKELRQSAYMALAVGYCDLHYLLRYEQPFAYVAGSYGWDFDAYLFGDILVTTGYRGMIGYSIPCEAIREIESKAKNIVEDCGIAYDEKRKMLHEMATAFFEGQLEIAHREN